MICGTGRGPEMRPNLMWRLAVTLALVSAWVLLGAVGWGRAEEAQLRVTPSQVSVAIDPSRVSSLELAGGLQAYLLFPTDAEQLTLGFSLTPLIDQASGRALPADRLLVGVGDLQPMSAMGQQPIPLSASGPTIVQIGVQAGAFDSPGLYQGRLCLSANGGSVEAVANVDVQIEILPWAAIRQLAPSPLVVTSQDIPGPDAVMSSEEQYVLLVAGNHRWQLVVQAPDGLQPQSGPATAPLAGRLDMRVFPSDWVQPVTNGFAELTEDPAVLAVGKPTGDCADGWVAVSLEVRMPYGRHQAAGAYSGDLTLAVRPY